MASLPILHEDGSIMWQTSLFLCSYITIVVWVTLQARQGPPSRVIQIDCLN